MKSILAFLGLVLLLSCSAHAAPGSDMIIKQRAKEIRDQNNVRQGVTSPSQPAQPAPPATAPTTSPTITAVQQAKARLRADLSAIQANSHVTPEQKQQIAKDLIALAQANKPSAQTAAVLAEDLSAAFAQKPLSDKDHDRLLSDLSAVLNPGNIQKAQMDAIFADIQAIFQVNGQTRKDAVKITDDARTVGGEVKNGSAK
jgi:hypothetical protein